MPFEKPETMETRQPPVMKLKAEPPATASAQRQFWKQLRHFYRTGQPPASAPRAGLTSVFSRLVTGAGAFPFSLGETKVPYSSGFIFRVLNFQLVHFQKDKSNYLKQKLNNLTAGLGRLLAIKQETDSDRELYGFAAEIIAFDKLQELIPTQRDADISPMRKERLQLALKTLQEGLERYARAESLVLAGNVEMPGEAVFENTHVVRLGSRDVIQEAERVLKEQMDTFTLLMKALRIASLEVEGSYDETVHDEHFEHFTWYRLLDDEKGLFHPVWLIVDPPALTGHLESFSRLLSTNWPIRVLVLSEQQVAVPDPAVSWEDASHRYRQEVFSWTVSHRNVYFGQATPDAPGFLATAIQKSLEASHPAVVQVLLPPGADEGALTVASAATLGRYFPCIEYDPDRPGKNGPRLNLAGNPQPDEVWPSFAATFVVGKKQEAVDLRLTYGDYKAFFAAKVNELMEVPPAQVTDNLMRLDEYLQASQDQLYGKIPFIWLVDEVNELRRAAVPNNWVVSCQERADFWRFLLEMSGSAAGQLPEGGQLETAESLRKTCEQQVAAAREEATGLAVNRLLRELLND